MNLKKLFITILLLSFILFYSNCNKDKSNFPNTTLNVSAIYGGTNTPLSTVIVAHYRINVPYKRGIVALFLPKQGDYKLQSEIINS